MDRGSRIVDRGSRIVDRGSRSSQFLPLSPTFVKNFYFISIYRVFITQKETFLIPYRYKLLTI